MLLDRVLDELAASGVSVVEAKAMDPVTAYTEYPDFAGDVERRWKYRPGRGP